jgi:hypothetical protein
MKNLTAEEKNDFLEKHLRHRLTLLRTLRDRPETKEDYTGKGDIYRCVKDSNLIAVRLLLDFLGLKGIYNEPNYTLKQNPRKFNDDVKIDQFCGGLLVPADVPVEFQRVLAGVYVRTDKELAHLTTTFNEEFNTEEKLIEAAGIVENLLEKFLYTPLGKQLPTMDE